jgi:glycosyltransferase involved in cell wall biosynthesis
VLAASDVGGHLELIEHGKTGVLFKADDPQSLADNVGDLLAAQDQWPALRANGRRFVETERNWPISVARYKQIYARLTGLPST